MSELLSKEYNEKWECEFGIEYAPRTTIHEESSREVRTTCIPRPMIIPSWREDIQSRGVIPLSFGAVSFHPFIDTIKKETSTYLKAVTALNHVIGEDLDYSFVKIGPIRKYQKELKIGEYRKGTIKVIDSTNLEE
jgi:hypothetical protein